MAGAITRLAPTPSGFLHEGNAVHFLVVTHYARLSDAAVALRIDDMDAPRYRSEYADDIFEVLDWLGVPWTIGPRTRSEFEVAYSLRQRTERYRDELRMATGNGLEVFACRCSRSAATAARTQGCVSDCRDAGYTLVHGESALRASTPLGNVVLWRRDDMPAYHLASIVEDRDLGTTLVVRGEDLRDTTEIQRFLAPHFGAQVLARATFVHHPLLTDAGGRKLSKSQLATGPMTRDPASLSRIRAMAASLSG